MSPPTDPYLWPGGDTLANKLGHHDRRALARDEAVLVTARTAELLTRPVPGPTSLGRLQAIHLYLFQDVYEWAGQLRTIDIIRGDTTFCHVRFLTTYAAEVFGDRVRSAALTATDTGTWLPAVAGLLGDVNALHPFREGNGRAQRALVDHVALDTRRRPFQWGRISATENRTASVAAMHGDLGPMLTLLRTAMPGS